MKLDDLKNLITDIVVQASELKNLRTDQINAPVNYACIFCHSQKEYNEFLELANQLGKVVKETPSGPLYQIKPLPTIAGDLQLLKIRQPDATRTERGDADFTVSNYVVFKEKCLPLAGFKLIPKENFEMIELMDNKFKVRAYFSHPPLDEQLGIK